MEDDKNKSEVDRMGKWNILSQTVIIFEDLFVGRSKLYWLHQ